MAKKSPQAPPKTFEDALREVEQILAEIEGGSIGLEESLSKHERGAFLIQHCRGILDRAEKHIELLSRGPDDKLHVEKSPLAPSNSNDDSDEEAESLEDMS